MFNISFGKPFTINKINTFINKLLRTNIKPIYETPRAGDVNHSFTNIGKAQQFLGYQPKVDFLEGLRNIISSSNEVEQS